MIVDFDCLMTELIVSICTQYMCIDYHTSVADLNNMHHIITIILFVVNMCYHCGTLSTNIMTSYLAICGVTIQFTMKSSNAVKTLPIIEANLI